MALAFILHLPNPNMQGKLHVIVRNVGRAKAAQERAKSLSKQSSFHHRFSDGWGAWVTVIRVDNNESRKLRRQSLGFCGYDWMVDSILAHGKITDGKAGEA